MAISDRRRPRCRQLMPPIPRQRIGKVGPIRFLTRTAGSSGFNVAVMDSAAPAAKAPVCRAVVIRAGGDVKSMVAGLYGSGRARRSDVTGGERERQEPEPAPGPPPWLQAGKGATANGSPLLGVTVRRMGPWWVCVPRRRRPDSHSPGRGGHLLDRSLCTGPPIGQSDVRSRRGPGGQAERFSPDISETSTRARRFPAE